MKRYCLIQDNDSHWYVIPADKLQTWEIIVFDNEEVDIPAWAHRVGGSYTAVEFERPTIFGEEIE